MDHLWFIAVHTHVLGEKLMRIPKSTLQGMRILAKKAYARSVRTLQDQYGLSWQEATFLHDSNLASLRARGHADRTLDYSSANSMRDAMRIMEENA